MRVFSDRDLLDIHIKLQFFFTRISLRKKTKLLTKFVVIIRLSYVIVSPRPPPVINYFDLFLDSSFKKNQNQIVVVLYDKLIKNRE